MIQNQFDDLPLYNLWVGLSLKFIIGITSIKLDVLMIGIV